MRPARGVLEGVELAPLVLPEAEQEPREAWGSWAPAGEEPVAVALRASDLQPPVTRARRRTFHLPFSDWTPRYQAWRASHPSLAPDAALARRRAALARAFRAWPLVKAAMAERYGFGLPVHLARGAALLESLDGPEAQGLDWLGLSPAGVMEWFTRPRPTLLPGLDHRLHFRYYQDPPELVTILSGDTDGLHWGLWYDTPALPTCIAHNYARDTGESSEDAARTLVELIRHRLEEQWREVCQPEFGGEADRWQVSFRLAALRDAVRAFETGERSEVGSEYLQQWEARAPSARIHTLGGIGVRPEDDPGGRAAILPNDWSRYEAYRSDPRQVEAWIGQARVDVVAGLPGLALVVGHDLHWLSSPTYSAAALELLTGAWEILGRPALAEVARVHHAHRDLRSVGVYAWSEEEPA